MRATNAREGSIIALATNIFALKIARDNIVFEPSRVRCIASEAISSLSSLKDEYIKFSKFKIWQGFLCGFLKNDKFNGDKFLFKMKRNVSIFVH